MSTVQKGDGGKYLEKVIQVPFEIPAPNMRSIHETLFSKLNTILTDLPENAWDKNTWTAIYQYGIREYIHSIRDVIRYVNVFYLKYELLKEETNPVDLLGLTCLQVFEPLVYSRLPIYKDQLCGGFSTYSNKNQKSEEDKVQKIVDHLITSNSSVSNKTASKKLLGILFPKVHEACESFFGGRQYVHRAFLLNNNIAVPACFDRYFSLMLEDNAISSAIMKNLIFIAEENEISDQIEVLYQEGKLSCLLEEIEAYAGTASNDISAERAFIILKCLAEKWHAFEIDDVGFFAIPFPWRFLFCADLLLKRIGDNERYQYVQSLFEDKTIQPSTLSLLLEDFETSHGRYNEDGTAKDTSQQLLSLEAVIQLEQIFKRRAIESLDSRTLLNYHNGLSCLWMLGKLDPDLTAKKKREVVIDGISLSKVIGYCFSHGVTSLGYSSFKFWSLRKEALAEFVDVNDAIRQVNELIRTETFSSLSHAEQMNIAAFILAMDGENSERKEREIPEAAILQKLKEMNDECCANECQ